MRGNELVTRAEIRSLQHGVNLVQRHVQVPETADDLSRLDLVGRGQGSWHLPSMHPSPWGTVPAGGRY